MHLFRSDRSRIQSTVTRLLEIGVEYVAPCHCTGLEAWAVFYQSYGSRIKPIYAGSTLDVGSLLTM